MRLLLAIVSPLCLFAQVNPATEPASESVIRSWSEDIEVDGRFEAGRMEYVFDYQRQTVVERQYGQDGRLIRENLRPDMEVAASKDEIALAYELVRNDEELARFLAVDGRRLDGGFLLSERDPSPCGTHSRCIHVVAFDVDDTHPVFHAVVDLITAEVIYRNYTRTRRIHP